MSHFKHFFGLAKQNVAMKYHYGIHVIIIISTQQVTGGLFLRPIPGHMLQTVETTPQVTIYKCRLASFIGLRPDFIWAEAWERG